MLEVCKISLGFLRTESVILTSSKFLTGRQEKQLTKIWFSYNCKSIWPKKRYSATWQLRTIAFLFTKHTFSDITGFVHILQINFSWHSTAIWNFPEKERNMNLLSGILLRWPPTGLIFENFLSLSYGTTFHFWNVEISLTFQLFYDPYEPCHKNLLNSSIKMLLSIFKLLLEKAKTLLLASNNLKPASCPDDSQLIWCRQTLELD